MIVSLSLTLYPYRGRTDFCGRTDGDENEHKTEEKKKDTLLSLDTCRAESTEPGSQPEAISMLPRTAQGQLGGGWGPSMGKGRCPDATRSSRRKDFLFVTETD